MVYPRLSPITKKGKPTATVCSDRFEFLAKYTSKGLGMPDLPLVIVLHPIGAITVDEINTKVDNIIDSIISKLLS